MYAPLHIIRHIVFFATLAQKEFLLDWPKSCFLNTCLPNMECFLLKKKEKGEIAKHFRRSLPLAITILGTSELPTVTNSRNTGRYTKLPGDTGNYADQTPSYRRKRASRFPQGLSDVKITLATAGTTRLINKRFRWRRAHQRRKMRTGIWLRC